jgi:hypothetical protein
MKRLEATFSSGGLSYKGILSNISANGLFIRTNRGFAPGSIVDIELIMPDNRISLLKGVVKRTIKTPITSSRNGMGVELLEKDSIFMDYVQSFREEPGTVQEPEQEIKQAPPQAQEFHIISCPNCGVKNKVLSEKLVLGPKCGRCGTPLNTSIP